MDSEWRECVDNTFCVFLSQTLFIAEMLLCFVANDQSENDFDAWFYTMRATSCSSSKHSANSKMPYNHRQKCLNGFQMAQEWFQETEVKQKPYGRNENHAKEHNECTN